MCNKKETLNLKLFICDGCSKSNCVKCGKISPSEVKVLELKGGRTLKFYCLKCLNFNTFSLLQNTINDKRTIIDSKDEIICLLRGKIEELETDIEAKKGENSRREVLSYSQTLQNKTRNRENIPSLIIKPKKYQSVEATTRDLQNKVKPTELKIGIKNTRGMKNGGLIVKCVTKTDVDKLKMDAENKLEGYEIQITKMRLPRIKISGYRGDMTMEKIELCLREQNEFIQVSDELKITYIKQNKKNQSKTIFGECSPQLFRQFMERKRIFMEWERYPIYEDLSIQRCFHCQEHYHKNINCSNEPMCEYCSEGHNVQECPKVQKKCGNCFKANEKFNLQHKVDHEASSRECPSYQYLLGILKGKIDYGT